MKQLCVAKRKYGQIRYLCFSPPPDPLGDRDPPAAARAPLPTVVELEDLCVYMIYTNN